MLLALLGGRDRPLEVVDYRQQLAHDAALGALASGRSLAGRALAVVLEVGLGALREIQIFVALALGCGQRILRIRLGRLLVLHGLLLVGRVLLAGGLARLVSRRDGLLLRRDAGPLGLERHRLRTLLAVDHLGVHNLLLVG